MKRPSMKSKKGSRGLPSSEALWKNLKMFLVDIRPVLIKITGMALLALLAIYFTPVRRKNHARIKILPDYEE
jgi:hypothetical protein